MLEGPGGHKDLGREILARQGGKERLFTTLDGNRDIFDERHRTLKPP